MLCVLNILAGRNNMKLQINSEHWCIGMLFICMCWIYFAPQVRVRCLCCYVIENQQAKHKCKSSYNSIAGGESQSENAMNFSHRSIVKWEVKMAKIFDQRKRYSMLNKLISKIIDQPPIKIRGPPQRSPSSPFLINAQLMPINQSPFY